jgi:uncharacterized membrane protein YcgQ (UPF0703/DUF1980 family)
MPVGFFCEADSMKGFFENDWVSVTGIVKPESVKFHWDNEHRTIPVLRVVSMQKTSVPQQPYIYQVAY